MGHMEMLAPCKVLLEYRKGTVAIHHRFIKIITALRTAVENGEDVESDFVSNDHDLFSCSSCKYISNSLNRIASKSFFQSFKRLLITLILVFICTTSIEESLSRVLASYSRSLNSFLFLCSFRSSMLI